MLETFTAQTFAPLVDTVFQVGPDSAAPTSLQLMQVTEWGTPGSGGVPAGPRRTPFTLLFRGPHTPVLPQQIYELTHPALGAVGIFIVPIGPDAQGMRYEAVFT